MKNLEDIRKHTIQTYEKHAQTWDMHRPRVLIEKPWLDKFIELLPPQGRVLDVGCGAGEPITGYLLKQGFDITGLDASPGMLEIARMRFPNASWVEMDMRDMQFDTKFDGIISWDGSFHLTQAEQRQLLLQFARHLHPNGALLMTIGHEAGEVTGTVEGDAVYHASMAPDEYRDILRSLEFGRIEIKLQDENCGLHSILLAQKQ
ncbi:MAG: class I SAM-dependent methyltransferase [Gammaproteobacteria bacterium]|nr:class I SAM-dependent methyltransferase [Gammaproteobacteria bacterium]NNM13739.1 class I SAM-dependent methyltransferase [Gammaproteobacteria bacterium]